jgi:hypothetical protein
MRILDLSAGNRAIWYDKKHPLCIYLDRRAEVEPDIVCDTNLGIPPSVGTGFNLICWDPPHMPHGPNSDMARAYGRSSTAQILDLLSKTGREAWLVSAPKALLAFKWNTHDIKLNRVFSLLSDWEPLFGHLTKDGPRSQTYWIMFLRRDGFPDPGAFR